MMQPLKNSRHEKFALNIFKGMPRKKAAEEAGYSPRTSDLTAYRLIRNDRIFDRIQEMHKEAASDAIMTVRQRKERLSKIAKEDIEGKFGTLRQPNISAIAELNKMEGEYPPSKLELTGKGGGPIEVEHDAKGKLIQILNRLAGRLKEGNQGK
ncbi:MAG: terminase small subunit [Dehalococcoidia bacterium]|nr:terminase small subunit [Dehalococcoidia bacterium]